MPRPASTPPTMMEPRGGVEGERAASNNRAVTPASASGAFGRPREGWSMSREPSQGFRAQRPTTASELVREKPGMSSGLKGIWLRGVERGVDCG
eukprot:1213965-Rhodomonas_salina.1